MKYLEKLEARFKENKAIHKNIAWDDVRLLIEKADIAHEITFMEETGGEPHLVNILNKLCIVDFATEQTEARMSVCYDEKARRARKRFPPKHSAEGLIGHLKLRLINEHEYFALQELGSFDIKTSVWLHTPENVHLHGDALYGGKKYDRTFVFHNGADSYYNNRGFRTIIHLE